MNQKYLRPLTDVAMWFLFCFLFGTGALIHYRLIPGFKGGHGLSLFGMSRHEWGEYHLWAAYLLALLLCVHLTLNFAFIKNAIAKRANWRSVTLLLGGLIFVGFFLFVPITKEEGHGPHGKHQKENGGGGKGRSSTD